MAETPSRPDHVSFGSLAGMGGAALVVAVVATALDSPLARYVPRSLVFSGTLLGAAVLSRRALPAAQRDRGVALAAAASAGAAPLVAFCCDQALTVPTWDSRPLEGLGPLVVAAIAGLIGVGR